MLGLFAMSLGVSLMAADQPLTPPLPAVATTNTAGGPKIQFATPVYDFGKVKSGELVKYSYAYTNGGDQALEVTHVQPSCGCTTAGEWTKKVEPGQTGNIPVQFNSANFNGQVFKTITVSCNDKAQPTTVLQLKGTIWKPIEISPPYAVLNIQPDAPSASTVVRIINNMAEPIALFAPEGNNPAYTATITTNQPGKEYQMTISTVPPLHPGTIQAQFSVKTSSTNAPVLTVPLWANVQPALMVMPPQITLPPAPLANQATPSVTIQNNSTNQVTLSELMVNVPGIGAQLKEIQPGKVFSATLTFPQGFEIAQGQQVQLTLKSSHPQFPVIKVPVAQMPRPMAPPRPPAGPPTLPPPMLPQAPKTVGQ